MENAVCLLSGGQDSTTSLFWAKDIFDDITCLIIDYGQKHSVEIKSAIKISTLANVSYNIIKVPFFKEIGNSALLDSSIVNQNHPNNADLPSSFVPGRNLIFITIAAMMAYKLNANNIVTGVCETDYSGYPDCRKETIKSLEKTINLGMESKITIHTPLMYIDKKATIYLAESLKGCMEALKYSHTCYNGEYPPCGKCPSCKLRAKGFKEAGIIDPIFLR